MKHFIKNACIVPDPRALDSIGLHKIKFNRFTRVGELYLNNSRNVRCWHSLLGAEVNKGKTSAAPPCPHISSISPLLPPLYLVGFKS